MTRLTVILIFLFTGFSIQTYGQRAIVGGEVKILLESAHPYLSVGGGKVTWKKEVTVSEARYIAIHFDKFELAKNDYVVIRSVSGAQSYRYFGKGKNSNNSDAGFWAPHIKGETAVIELYSINEKSAFGLRIDRFVSGYRKTDLEVWDNALREIFSTQNSHFESVCGMDDSKWAKCYENTDPTIYATSRAVVRLLTKGRAYCTGWLVGSEGHVITNNHCVRDDFDARDTDFEIMAEGNSCATNCVSEDCDGTIISSGGTLVKTDRDLDYTLIKLHVNPTQEYGFMQLRGEVELGERVYLPGHPNGWGKKISFTSSHPKDVDGYGVVHSLTENRCARGDVTKDIREIGYFLDTRGGSSGSPLIAYEDNLVVGLHHCKGTLSCSATAGGLNRAVPISVIIEDLGELIPKDAVFVSNPYF